MWPDRDRPVEPVGRTVLEATDLHLVPVVIGLVRPGDVDAQVGSLLGRELGQVDTERIQVQPSDSLVEMLGQRVDPERILLGLVKSSIWAST